MNKELQDHVWKHCLPKEFKEEVKRVANIFSRRTSGMIGGERTLADTFLNEFINLFGKHNLTSDAEGEEMLTVKAKTVREMYAANDRLKASFPGTIAEADADKINHILRHLFGSKCLPDNVDSSHGNVDSSEPQPSEPKFKVGDKAFLNNRLVEVSVVEEGGYYFVISPDRCGYAVMESDLEPYTEPEESNCTIKSDTCKPVTDRHHFEENRLHIAAMAMQGILSNEKLTKICIDTYKSVVRSTDLYKCVALAALDQADALISESKKETNRAMEQEE